MDPIEHINPKKDSTLAMMLAAQRKGWAIFYLPPEGLLWDNDHVMAEMYPVTVQDDLDNWFSLGIAQNQPLAELDIILMRKDPPFDMEYIYQTYLLEKAEQQGVLIVNKPRSLRDANEKFFATEFPDCIPPTLVGRNPDAFKAFLQTNKSIIVKPLDGMGGASIFRIDKGDPNTNVILETLLDFGKTTAMAQRFLPEYIQGDKRILMIDGEAIPWALARIPAQGEGRANLAAGGSWKGMALTQRDRYICQQVGPELKKRGLIFVGLDIIGDYLTEVNVTSPTCIRELDKLYNLDIAGQLIDCLDSKIHPH